MGVHPLESERPGLESWLVTWGLIVTSCLIGVKLKRDNSC